MAKYTVQQYTGLEFQGGHAIVSQVKALKIKSDEEVQVLAAVKRYSGDAVTGRLVEQSVFQLCAHPNMVRPFDFTDESVLMEWVHHGSLHDLCHKCGVHGRTGADLEFVRAVLFQALLGVVYLHEVHGIIHRDIKPANILVGEHGAVKLCDFECCWLPDLADFTAPETLTGTPKFQAPELENMEQYDNRADVYSLGATALAILNATTTTELPTEQSPLAGEMRVALDLMLQDSSKRPRALELLRNAFFRPCWGEVPANTREHDFLTDRDYCTDPREGRFYTGWATALTSASEKDDLVYCLKWCVTQSLAPAARTIEARTAAAQ